MFYIFLFIFLNTNQAIQTTMKENKNYNIATFGGGCFWCTEAIYKRLNGVNSVISGYAGGESNNPTYEDVCSGETGHAEVIQITFNPEIISYTELLEVFFVTHNPTTLNQQGADIGTQYRSVIFYHNQKQEITANNTIIALNNEQIWNSPIVTEIAPYDIFYMAEKQHQNYYDSGNQNTRYCQMVITPKLEKFKKLFKEKIK